MQTLSKLGRAVEEEIRERCASVIDQIESAVTVSWMPVELDVALSEAVDDVAGRDAYWSWGQQAILESARGPLLGPLLSGLQRLGLGPTHAIRRLRGGWGLIYRDCGEISVHADSGARRGRVSVTEIPTVFQNDPYLVGIAAAFDGVIMAVGGRDTRVEFERQGPHVTFDLRWS